MSDEAKIVELAVQAAGVADAGWADRVVALVPRVAALFREPRDEHDPTSPLNTARKTAEANVFTAEYRSHEYDGEGRDGNQPTQRVFVKVFDEKSQGDSDYLDENGCQTVRTEPMWSATGRVVRRTLESMVPGQKAVFYRYTEQIDKKRKMGLLVHLEPLRKPTQEARRAPSQSVSENPAPEARVSAPPEPSDDMANTAIGERINQLTTKQKVGLSKQCREAGIVNFMTPSASDADKVLVILGQVEKE